MENPHALSEIFDLSNCTLLLQGVGYLCFTKKVVVI